MELTLGYLDDATGSLLLDDELPTGAAADLAETLGQALSVGCAKPQAILSLRNADPDPATARHPIRINGYWHDDFMVGPGRRSVVRMQGCPIRCKGCWVPETHDENGGYEVNVDVLASALLDESHVRDGVTIVGGEPFAQPVALLHIIRELRAVQPDLQIAVYTGYTFEALRRRGDYPYAIERALSGINILIVGPYVQAKPHSANCGCDDETRRWTGSCGQRVNYLIPF